MKLATKNERKALFKRIRQKKRKKRMPFSIMHELTYQCNFRCPHCYLGEQRDIKKKELNTGEVKKVLDELADIGVYSIGFTGGEPLVRKDIFEILDYANKKGFRFGLLTNGYLIDEQRADKLKKANVGKVDITFNSMRPETFAALSGVRDGYEKVFGAVSLLLKRKMQVAIKSTATSLNKDELEQISKFARKKNIPYRIDGEVLPCRGGCEEWVDKFSLDAETFLDIRRKVHPEMYENRGGKRRRTRTRRKRGRVFNCGVGISSFSINPYGEMNFCLEIDYPELDILKLGAQRCWEKLKEEVDSINNLALKGDFICKDCELLRYCGWCAGRSYLETGTFNKCSEYFKQRAIERKKSPSRR